MAWVANRSTTVRKAIRPITRLRRKALAACGMTARRGVGWTWLSVVIGSVPGSVGAASLTPGAVGRASRARVGRRLRPRSHHVRVVGLVQEVGGDQHGRRLAGVLPPVRRALDLLGDLAGVVDDRHRAVAGV